MASPVSLQTLITNAISYSDQTNSNFISPGEWTLYANACASVLYNQIVTADQTRYIQRNPDYVFPLQTGYLTFTSLTKNFTVGATITGATSHATAIVNSVPDQVVGNTSGTIYCSPPSGGNQTFTLGETITDSSGGVATVAGVYTAPSQFNPLPANFWLINRVDYVQTYANPLVFYTILAVNQMEEEVYQAPYCSFYGTGLRYLDQNNYLMFVPAPNISGLIRLLYTPCYKNLVNLTDTIDDLSGFSDSVAIGMAILALQKEGTDASVLQGIKQQKDFDIMRIVQATRDKSTPKSTIRLRRRNRGFGNNGSGAGGV